MKQITFDLISLPAEPLQALTGDSSGLNFLSRISIDQFESRQVIPYELESIIVLSCSNASRTGSWLGDGFFPEETRREEFICCMRERLRPCTQNLEIGVVFKIEHSWRVHRLHDVFIRERTERLDEPSALIRIG